MRKILVAAVFPAVALLLAACGSVMTPDQTASKAFDAIKTLDKQTAERYVDYDQLMDFSEGDNLASDDATMKLLIKHFSYKIISTNIIDDKAILKAEITNLDFKPIFDEYVKEAGQMMVSNALAKGGDNVTDDQLRLKMQDLFQTLLNISNAKQITVTVEFTMTKEQDGWQIEPNDALQDAVFGGLSGEIRNMVKQGQKLPGAD
ncbi:MAG: DUF5105 domain-containing protein [Clostridiales bacterium]|nr:DUF5105 domain-containing protein [Clostridiales bacterium]